MATESITKQPTGIPELDEVLEGGLPKNFNIIVRGTPGTGKTLLSQQWLYEGYHQYDEPGLYIGFTESNEKTIENLKGLSFYDQKSTNPKAVHFTDFRLIMNQLAFDTHRSLPLDDLDQVIDVIRHIADNMKAKRIVIDSISAILNLLESPVAIRNFVFYLGNALTEIGATILLISELSKDDDSHGIEEFIADGLIAMANVPGQQRMVRTLNILKMRGSSYRSGEVALDITEDGLLIYPKIPSYTSIARTNFDIRLSSGVKEVDALIGGGIPQGNAILFGGNTGSGKSTFGLHFAAEGIKRGDNVCFVALEESVTQVKKTASQHGFDFDTWEKKHKLAFVTAELIDIYPDKLLYDIIRSVQNINAKRIVFDSISSMENSAFDRTRVRQFLLQLMAYIKKEGITLVMTYLTTELFGASEGQLMSGTASTELGLSSMVDGIVLLRYVERDQEVKKLLTILKMRGSDHEKSIYEFKIGSGGIQLGGKFKE